MKKSFLFFFCSVVALWVQAQDDTPKTLLGNSPKIPPLGVVVVPSVQLTDMGGATTALFNLRGGLTLGKKVTLGAFYTQSMNDPVPDNELIPGIHLDYVAGGAMVEYTWKPDQLLHLTFPLLIGVGEVEMDGDGPPVLLGSSSFMTVEPAALLELNIHKYVRFNAGLSYRWISNMDYRNLDQSDISGFSFQAGIKFGWFR